MGLYETHILPFLPVASLPEPWLKFSDSLAGQFSLVDGKVTAYTCPNSGVVLSQSTASAQPSYANGRMTLNGSQWLQNTQDVWRFLHDGSPWTVVGRFVVTGDPVTQCNLMGNNGSSSSKRGLNVAYDNRPTSIVKAFQFLVGNGTNGSGANQQGETGITHYNDSFNAAAQNSFFVRHGAGFDFKTNRREVSMPSKGVYSTAAATHEMRFGSNGGTSLSLVGELRDIYIYKEYLPTETVQKIYDHINQQP